MNKCFFFIIKSQIIFQHLHMLLQTSVHLSLRSSDTLLKNL